MPQRISAILARKPLPKRWTRSAPRSARPHPTSSIKRKKRLTISRSGIPPKFEWGDHLGQGAFVLWLFLFLTPAVGTWLRAVRVVSVRTQSPRFEEDRST